MTGKLTNFILCYLLMSKICREKLKIKHFLSINTCNTKHFVE